MTETAEYGRPSMGCYADHANYNIEELNLKVVAIAVDFGFVVDGEAKKLLARFDYDVTREDDAENLESLAEEAIEWLNGQETRPFMYWAHDGDAGAFGLWANVDGAKDDSASSPSSVVGADAGAPAKSGCAW